MSLSTSIFAINDINNLTEKNRINSHLQDELQIYQQALSNPLPSFTPNQELFYLGDKDETIKLLRQHLKRSHDLALDTSDTNLFDRELQSAVKLFQSRHGLKADGVVGHDTKLELNILPAERIRQLNLNLQRWSQLLNKVGSRYLLVNIPEYKLHLIDNDAEVLSMKVIVGKPTRATPEITSTITRLVFNPYWNVPDLIAQKDIVPKILENPNYLSEKGIRIFRQDGRSSELNESEIDWQDAASNGFKYHFRQEPGEENALGQVKFEFENSHSVYLHDTPGKNLFASDQRDLSSGCIRLEKPFELVNYFTKNDPAMDELKIQDTLNTQKISYYKVKSPLKIYIAYLTVWVDSDNLVHYGKDIYWQDSDNPAL